MRTTSGDVVDAGLYLDQSFSGCVYGFHTKQKKRKKKPYKRLCEGCELFIYYFLEWRNEKLSKYPCTCGRESRRWKRRALRTRVLSCFLLRVWKQENTYTSNHPDATSLTNHCSLLCCIKAEQRCKDFQVEFIWGLSCEMWKHQCALPKIHQRLANRLLNRSEKFQLWFELEDVAENINVWAWACP